MRDVKTPDHGNWREVLRIVIPLMATGSAFSVMQFCDRMFLSKYSSLALGAAMPSGNLAFTLIGLFAAISGFSGSFVAQYFGAGNREACVKATMHGIILSFMCLPFFITIIPLGRYLISFFGHTPELVANEMLYYRWMAVGGVFVGFGWAVGGYFTGQSRLAPNVIANLIGCAVNIFLDYSMIFGKFGFPEMGIEGAAIATFISSIVAPLLQFVWMMRDAPVRNMGWEKIFTIDWKFMRKLIRFGFPSGVQLAVDVGGFTFFAMLTASLDLLQLTASNIAFSINNLAFSPLMSFGNAAAIVAGQYHGKGETDSCRRSGSSGIKIGGIYMIFIGLVFTFFPITLMSLFSPDGSSYNIGEMMRVCRHLIIVMTIWGFFDVANVIFMSTLKGVGDTKFVMLVISGLSWLLWIPGEIVIFRQGLGIIAGWIWMAVYVGVCAIFCTMRWYSDAWVNRSLIRDTE